MFNFDLSNGYVLLRLIVGLFLIPHAIGKVRYREPVTGFFTAAGFKPAPLFVTFGLVFEVVVGAALVLGILTQIAAALTAVFMLVAAVANHRVCKGKWLWNIGGSEYPIFWGLCALIVALNPT
jgi:putative oxidoreductase